VAHNRPRVQLLPREDQKDVYNRQICPANNSNVFPLFPVCDLLFAGSIDVWPEHGSRCAAWRFWCLIGLPYWWEAGVGDTPDRGELRVVAVPFRGMIQEQHRVDRTRVLSCRRLCSLRETRRTYASIIPLDPSLQEHLPAQYSPLGTTPPLCSSSQYRSASTTDPTVVATGSPTNVTLSSSLRNEDIRRRSKHSFAAHL
jgi:hypothetical protein